MEKYKIHIVIGFTVLLLFNLMATCSSNSKQNAINRKLASIDTVLTELQKRPALTDQQIRDAVKDESMETMYKYLIYETDLDQKKTSLSQIRSDVDREKSR